MRRKCIPDPRCLKPEFKSLVIYSDSKKTRFYTRFQFFFGFKLINDNDFALSSSI